MDSRLKLVDRPLSVSLDHVSMSLIFRYVDFVRMISLELLSSSYIIACTLPIGHHCVKESACMSRY
jgi:hypothetical protein